MHYQYIQIGFYLIIYLFIIFAIGNFSISILNLQISGKHAKVFLKLLAGVFTTVFLYSVFKTNFQTISTGLIIGFILLWSTKKFRFASIQKFQSNFFDIDIKKQIWITVQLSGVAIIIYLWDYYYLVSGAIVIPNSPHPDLVYFARLSDFLNWMNVETFEMNYLASEVKGTSPYHYFEIWNNALLTTLFKINSSVAMQLLSIPIYLTIVVSGIWAIMEQFKTVDLFHKLIGISVVLISGFYFQVYDQIPLYWTCYFQINLLDQSTGLKTSIMYLGILVFLVLLFKQKYKEALFSLLLFPFTSIFAMFSFVPTCMVLSIYFLYRKKIQLRTSIILIATSIFTLIYFQLFYKFTSNEAFYSNVIEIKTVIKQLPLVSIQSRLIIAVEKFIELIILYSPFILLIPFMIKQIKQLNTSNREMMKDLFLCFSGFIVCSLISWNFFYFVWGTQEFFQTTIMAIVNISCCLLFYMVYSSRKNKIVKTGLGIYFIGLLIFQAQNTGAINTLFSNHVRHKYSAEYIATINSLKLSGQGACISDSKINLSNVINPPYYVTSPYMNYMRSDFGISNISIYNIPNGEKAVEDLSSTTFVHALPFVMFVENQKKNNSFKSIKESQLNFIDENKIEFLVIAPGMDQGELLKTRLKKEIIDSKSGEKFWLFN